MATKPLKGSIANETLEGRFGNQAVLLVNIPMDFEIIRLQEVVSTNSWLLERGTTTLCKDGTAETNIVVVADYQTGGRGCGTNSWESERGKNLLFSVLLHPTDLPVRNQFRISMAVSVALCEMLSQYGDGFSIKWPNDIYWNDRKICGMLIENRVSGSFIKQSIVGVGLNVNQRAFYSDAPNPVSLYQIVGHELNCDKLLEDFLGRLESVYSRNTLCFDYGNHLFRRGILSEYADAAGRFKATLDRVGDDGMLVLSDLSGRERIYAFKEVQFIL